jgi:hypothetical protein
VSHSAGLLHSSPKLSGINNQRKQEDPHDFFVDRRLCFGHTVFVPIPNDAKTTAPFTDYEARTRVAQSLLASCKAERYVYLFFSALAFTGVLVALVYIFMTKTPTLANLGMLTSSGGAISVTGYRILRIEHDLFQVVFGIKL